MSHNFKEHLRRILKRDSEIILTEQGRRGLPPGVLPGLGVKGDKGKRLTARCGTMIGHTKVVKVVDRRKTGPKFVSVNVITTSRANVSRTRFGTSTLAPMVYTGHQMITSGRRAANF